MRQPIHLCPHLLVYQPVGSLAIGSIRAVKSRVGEHGVVYCSAAMKRFLILVVALSFPGLTFWDGVLQADHGDSLGHCARYQGECRCFGKCNRAERPSSTPESPACHASQPTTSGCELIGDCHSSSGALGLPTLQPGMLPYQIDIRTVWIVASLSFRLLAVSSIPQDSQERPPRLPV